MSSIDHKFRRSAIRSALLAGVAMVACLTQVPALWGQSRAPFLRSGESVKKAFAELGSPIAPSIVNVYSGEKRLALGTIVSADGLIVTKASEIVDTPSIECRLWDGRQMAAEVVAQDESTDLALLRIAADDLPAIEFTRERRPTAGSFLISIGQGGQVMGWGIAEVDPRAFSLRQPRPSDRGYLGVNCNADEDQRGLIVQQVTDNSAARKAGVRRGDLIVSIDDNPLTQVEQLVRELRQHKAGDSVRLVIHRGEEQLSITAELGAAPAFDPYDQWGGGPFSKRRFGFDSVIVHDTNLPPNLCGGPLLDTDGRVVGINIARALRVASYALPSETVLAFVRDHQNGPAAEAIQE